MSNVGLGPGPATPALRRRLRGRYGSDHEALPDSVCPGAFAFVGHAATKPNIVYILCDDLGYGDVKCLNPQGKIATPHVDKLAADGMIFTDAHSSSSVCSPTRYGIMTGRYNWRSRLQSGVLGGLSPRLIEPGRLTVAQMLKDQGHDTAGEAETDHHPEPGRSPQGCQMGDRRQAGIPPGCWFS